jgi:tetratricopeptide (TPR) repeat protein
MAGAGSLFAAQQAAAPSAQSTQSAQASPPAQASAAKTSQAPINHPGVKPAAADENAFPEAQSEAAQRQAADEESADRKAASSGSSTPSAADSGSSSRDKLAGIDILGDHDSRIANGAGGTIVDPKLSLEDQRVGRQYMQMGDYVGAYNRFKEAATVNPANADAVFYLAEAARKTAHLDEAAENYRIYLLAEPDGPRAKAARKALAQLQGK